VVTQTFYNNTLKVSDLLLHTRINKIILYIIYYTYKFHSENDNQDSRLNGVNSAIRKTLTFEYHRSAL
jgi:hypothetical protein